MAPAQQAVPLHLPPSSPHYGVIRLMRHEKIDKPIQSPQDTDRSDVGPRQAPKDQSPTSQHSSLKDRKSLDEDRDRQSGKYSAQDRSGSMRRELSNPRSAREGGVSVIHRSEMMTDRTEDPLAQDAAHNHAGHQHRIPPHQLQQHHHQHHQHQHHHHHHQSTLPHHHHQSALPHHHTPQNPSRHPLTLGRGPGQQHGITGLGMPKSSRTGSNQDAVDQGSRLDVESQSSSTRAGPSNHAGKLFDPRKDDPVRFAALKTKHGLVATSAGAASTTPVSSTTNPSTSTFSASSYSDSRSNASLPTTNASSGGGREKRRRRGPSSRTTADSSGNGKKPESVGVDNNSYVRELKRWYREIATVEQKLQEEHRAASDRQRRDQAELKSCSDPLYARFRSGKPGFTSKGRLDHAYWIDIVSKHRYLAETHAAFMEAAMKPGLPTSLHSLPQNYNIPTRLWQTGFHSLLERLRHALPSLTPASVESVPAKEIEACKSLQHQVLDLIIEFIYFAYSFYTNLLESETFKSFRNSWIENLGDLARYRMAVAKIMAKPEVGKYPPRDEEDFVADGRSGSVSEKCSGPSTPPEAEHENDSEEIQHEKGSIGVGALQGWDLEETEVWRANAKEWYALGLAEMPGTGRLHHHLGILSRDDELRSLHHFCKSLTCSHPYASGRESLLPLFERDVQQQRLRSDASLIDLFLHLHGLLFTKVQLDDFDTILSRFEAMLQSETSRSSDSGGSIRASTWIMMATISVASLLQYEAYSSPPKVQEAKADNTEKVKVNPAADDTRGGNEEHEGRGDEDENDEEEEEQEGEGEEDADERAEDQKKTEQSARAKTATPKVSAVVTIGYAAKLTFSILSAHIVALLSTEQPRKVNPFVTMLLTFLSQECKQTAYLKLIERRIPWLLLVRLGGTVPCSGNSIDPRRDTATRMRADSGPLAEDWSLRGMAWVGRKVYERGFWKSRTKNGTGMQQFESEVEMLNYFSSSSNTMEDKSTSSSSSSGESAGEQDRGKSDETTVSLSTLRWRRVAHTLTILAKTIPGLDFQAGLEADSKAGELIVTSPLKDKMLEWRLEEELELQEQEGLIRKLTIDAKEPQNTSEGEVPDVGGTNEVEEGGGDDEINDTDNEEIRRLKERRQELRKELLMSRLAATNVSRSSREQKASMPLAGGKKDMSIVKDKDKNVHANILPSYTVLVLDTNVLLTPTNVLEQLIKSEKWCAVVPLVVVTELQGLTKRPGMIGQRAQRCIDYLEKNVKAKSHYVKVQTSRGNYLNDLQFRTEDIDFSGVRPAQTSMPLQESAPPPSSTAPPSKSRGPEDRDEQQELAAPHHQYHRMARSIDEVILFCLDWQKNYFMDRSAFLCKDRIEFQQTQSKITDETCKVVLITLDKNLRLKAKYKEMIAVSPDEIADLIVIAEAGE